MRQVYLSAPIDFCNLRPYPCIVPELLRRPACRISPFLQAGRAKGEQENQMKTRIETARDMLYTSGLFYVACVVGVLFAEYVQHGVTFH